MKWNFAEQLQRHGPDGRTSAVSRASAHAYCRRLALAHYENFSVASFLLPRHLLRHFYAVYAYCRWADDLADEALDSGTALRRLAWWREQLLACYRGDARHPVFVALHDTLAEFAIPQTPFLDLLVAFEQDQYAKRYATFEQLLGYCRYSANPVGRLVLYLCRAHDLERAQLADFICTALQLANFWQDVSRDLDIGRIYLPTEDRLRFGYGDRDLEARAFTPAFAELLRFEVERTRDLFFRGYPLVDRVGEVGGQVELFVLGGLAILDKIEAAGFDVLSRRPTLSKWDKSRLVGGALWRRVRRAIGGRR